MVFSKKENVIFVLCFMVVTFSGCDFIIDLMKPKQIKKTVAAQPVVAPKPAEDKNAPLSSDVLARVGDWTLPLDEFNVRIMAVKKQVPDFDDKDPASKKMVLEEIVRQQLLVEDARAQGLHQKKEIMDATKDFQNSLLVQEYVNNITKDVKADDAEAKAYYEAHANEFIAPMVIQVREIAVPTETEAKDILVQVLQGGDFAQLARERSKAKSAANGGDLGFLQEAPFPQMLSAVQGLSKGAVSSVFQGPEGYYLAKVEDTKGGNKVPLSDIKEDLIKALTLQKQQKVVVDKLNEVKSRVVNKVNLDLLGKTGD
ncbi:MAG: peptidyl-prolyl cis-trans isomerase [Candidatus Omnitrophica bacterium]|nr:peptidyl-prolyl cis-trans isomerase [Candidatus Omnitrophota bacterium]